MTNPPPPRMRPRATSLNNLSREISDIERLKDLITTAQAEVDQYGKPKPAILSISQIKLDEYQRPLRQYALEQIAKNYIPEINLPICVNRRENGMYYCFDGKHRLNREDFA